MTAPCLAGECGKASPCFSVHWVGLPPASPPCLYNWGHSLALCQQAIWYIARCDFSQFFRVVLQLLLRRCPWSLQSGWTRWPSEVPSSQPIYGYMILWKINDVFSLCIPHWVVWQRQSMCSSCKVYVYFVHLSVHAIFTGCGKWTLGVDPIFTLFPWLGIIQL